VADIGSLIIKIGADASGLQKAFSDLGGSAKQFQRGLETVAKIASTAFLAAATSAVAMTIAAGKQAEELDQLAAVTGINTDKLQEYDVMLNRAGLSGQDLAVMMKNVSNSLDQARQGTGTAGDRFRQLGIDITKVTSTDDLIHKLVAATGKLADGTGKAAIMSDLMGKSWQQFMKAFQGGEKEFANMGAASKNLGNILTTSQIEVLKQMDDQIDDLGTAYKRFGQQLGVTLAPNVKFITELLKELMVWGAKSVGEWALGLDILSTKVQHFGLQMEELSGTLFSSKIFSSEAWEQTLANLKFIGVQSDQQVERLRWAFEASKKIVPPPDKRPPPPDMIDTAKVSQQAQALADAQLKADQDLFKRKGDVAQAYFTQQQTQLASNQARGLASDVETANDEMRLLDELNNFKTFSLTKELANYQQFVDAKRALFTNDQKGQADKAKFEVEAAGKTVALQEQIRIAGVQSTTDRIAGETKLFTLQQKHALDSLDAQTILADATLRQQDVLYQQESSFIGAADAARRVAFEAQSKRYALDLAQLEQSLALKQISEETYNAKVTALEQDADTKRRAIIQQYPTFFEQQMRDVVNSNAFSVSQIITTWTGGLANAIVNGGNFVKAAWQSTQLAIVQGAINTGVQLAAQWLLQATTHAAIAEAEAASRIIANATADTTIVASNAAAAGSSVGLWATAAGGIKIALLSIGAAAKALWVEAILPALIAVGHAISGFLSAIAIAMKATIFGIPVGVAILIGVAAIFAALAAMGAIKLAEGGIVTGPTLSLIGEAGPEAVIPLSHMGKMGGMGGGSQTIVIQLDGREIARKTLEHMPGIIYMKTGLA
jgi:hypothetical protein